MHEKLDPRDSEGVLFAFWLISIFQIFYSEYALICNQKKHTTNYFFNSISPPHPKSPDASKLSPPYPLGNPSLMLQAGRKRQSRHRPHTCFPPAGKMSALCLLPLCYLAPASDLGARLCLASARSGSFSFGLLRTGAQHQALPRQPGQDCGRAPP